MRACIFVLVIAMTVGAKPIVTVAPDDVMDSPQPKAPLSRWTSGSGRRTISLNVPGATLRGFVYAGARREGPTLLMFGGSGNLVVRHDGAARAFAHFASKVVFYDYRGYGFSTGKAHFADLEADALRIYDAVEESSGRPVALLGYSMGTAVAEYVALHRLVGELSYARRGTTMWLRTSSPNPGLLTF